MRVGRYGWKADITTLELMVADAFANELGVRSALARPLQAPVEDDGSLVRAVVAFLRDLRWVVRRKRLDVVDIERGASRPARCDASINTASKDKNSNGTSRIVSSPSAVVNGGFRFKRP